MKPLTQADYVMTPENARDRALLIVAQDTDAPKLTDRLDAECMRVLVAEVDALRAALAAAEAKLVEQQRYTESAFNAMRDRLVAQLADERRHAASAWLALEETRCTCEAVFLGGMPSRLQCVRCRTLQAHAARRAAEKEADRD